MSDARARVPARPRIGWRPAMLGLAALLGAATAGGPALADSGDAGTCYVLTQDADALYWTSYNTESLRSMPKTYADANTNFTFDAGEKQQIFELSAVVQKTLESAKDKPKRELRLAMVGTVDAVSDLGLYNRANAALAQDTEDFSGAKATVITGYDVVDLNTPGVRNPDGPPVEASFYKAWRDVLAIPFLRGDPFEYTLGCLEDGDVHAERTQRGRRFQPDVTAAHDHNPPTRCSGGTDQLDVCSGTQVVNSGKIHPWCGESSGPCAGAQRELGVGQRVAGAQRHTLGTPVDRVHGRIQESNVLLFVEISAANQEVVEAVLAGQVSLRQRRPVVG